MNTLAPSRTPIEIAKTRRIGLLIWPGCEVLDVCGPFDAFHYANYWLLRFGRTGEPGYLCDLIAATPGPVRTTCGIELVATHSYSDIKDGLDTLVVAGGPYPEQAFNDPALVEWVSSTAPRARRVASVCTGAFILAAAGLLKDRRVTTHWMFSELLAMAYPSIQVNSSLIFERDGNIYTSGGITAGIDLALGREIPLAWWFFPGAPGGNPNSAPICICFKRRGGQTSANFKPGSWGIPGRISAWKPWRIAWA
jgi:transcriptional regulator GlxA family with amidase domain